MPAIYTEFSYIGMTGSDIVLAALPYVVAQPALDAGVGHLSHEQLFSNVVLEIGKL
jgi:hypothetical protein